MRRWKSSPCLRVSRTATLVLALYGCSESSEGTPQGGFGTGGTPNPSTGGAATSGGGQDASQAGSGGSANGSGGLTGAGGRLANGGTAASGGSVSTGGTGTAAGGAGTGGAAGAGTGGAGGTGAGGAGSPGGTCPNSGTFASPLPADRTARKVKEGFEFLEGPVWLRKQGVLLFSNIRFSGSGSEGWPPSDVMRLTPPSAVTPLIPNAGTNGMTVDPSGAVIACTHDDRAVTRFDPVTSARTTLASSFQGKRFNSPNDVVVRSDGTVYFTDPTWQLGNRKIEMGFKGVFRVSPTGQVNTVATDIDSPNGVALSPDERRLYVSNDANGAVLRFDVNSDGSTGDAKPFTTVAGADGMAMDCAGNLYVTASDGIRVVSPDGTPIGTITVAEKPNNCTFGGADGRDLYIAGRTTLFSIHLNVPGFP